MMRFLNRLLRMETINGNGRCPMYLYRWTLLKLPRGIGIYLHKFVGPDWSEDLHDHPKRFVSIGLRGHYWDARALDRGVDGCALPEMFSSTALVLVGPTQREWGFWKVRRGVMSWVPWREHVDPNNTDVRVSCIE